MAIELGRTCEDIITGFRGVAIGYVQYITGCNQVLIAPKTNNGALVDSQWIDEQRLAVDPIFPTIKLANGASPGFDKPAPRR